jgi:chaperonin GroEL
MLEMGMVDPTKVVSTAFQNAASIAALRITTEAMMAILPQDQPLAVASRMVGEM